MKLLPSALLTTVLLLAGCGVAYISPSVRPGPVAGANVDVVAITASNLMTANASAYHPQSLPSAFYANAGTGAAGRGLGALPPAANDPQTRPRALALRLPPQQVAQAYQIGVGDVVRLTTPEDGVQTFTVQDDGALAIPGVGRVQVADRSLEDAEAALFQRFVENQRDPGFALDITEFNARRVSIGGAVAQPSVIALTLSPLTLEQALATVGGVAAEAGDLASVRIYRDGQIYQIPASQLFGNRALPQIMLAAGDSIFVDTAFDLDQAEAYFGEQIRLAEARQSARVQALRELEAEVGLRRASLSEARETFQQRLELGGVDRDYVYLTGEVVRQSRFPLPFASTASLADALYAEGGFETETGNPGQIYILRGNESGSRITAWQLDARNAAALVLATRMELRPNDIIFIAEQPVTRWNRVVQQIVPSLINTTVNAAGQ